MLRKIIIIALIALGGLLVYVAALPDMTEQQKAYYIGIGSGEYVLLEDGTLRSAYDWAPLTGAQSIDMVSATLLSFWLPIKSGMYSFTGDRAKAEELDKIRSGLAVDRICKFKLKMIEWSYPWSYPSYYCGLPYPYP